GAQVFQGGAGAGGFQVPGGGVDVLVRGQGRGGGQVAAGQGEGPGRLGPAIDPGVLLRFVPPSPGGFGVEFQDGAVQHPAQLAGGQRGRVGGDQGVDRGGGDVAEPGELAGEHDRARQVDPPGG